MHQGMASKVYGRGHYCLHRYDDGFYHRMIDNAKQDEPLLHLERAEAITGVHGASNEKNMM